MAFLALEDDVAALEEALRFIDEFDAATHQSSDAASCQRSKTRVRDPAVDARRRQRRKQERLALRQEAAELERRLSKAKRQFGPRLVRCDQKGERAAKRKAAWTAMVEAQQQRQVAEALNVLLRTSLAQQALLARAAYELVGQFDGSLPDVDSLVSGLTETVRRLQLEATCAWDPQLADCRRSDTSFKTDPVVGMYSETRVSAPVGMSVGSIAALMEQRIGSTRLLGLISVQESQQWFVLNGERRMEMALQDGKVQFRAVGSVLWSRTPDGIVLANSVILIHPNGKLCFRIGCWIRSRPSPANPAGESCFQSCSRVACGVLSGDVDEDTARDLSAGIQALSAKFRFKLERMHDKLVKDAWRFAKNQ